MGLHDLERRRGGEPTGHTVGKGVGRLCRHESSRLERAVVAVCVRRHHAHDLDRSTEGLSSRHTAGKAGAEALASLRDRQKNKGVRHLCHTPKPLRGSPRRAALRYSAMLCSKAFAEARTARRSVWGMGIKPASDRYPSSPMAFSLVYSATNFSSPGTTPT